MPTSDRHHAALSSATDTYRATPVGPSALPRLSTHALDAERARMARELDRVVGERTDVESAIDEAEGDRARAGSAVDRAEAEAAERRDRQVRLAAEAVAADARLAVIEQRRAELDASLGTTEADVDALDLICNGLGEILATIADGSLTPEQIGSAADELDRVALTTIDNGPGDAATALHEWSATLRGGTAAMHPSAAALLTALNDLERRWDDHGRGDLMADPAVASLRATLDEARAVQAEIESQASAGALGDRTMGAIRAANARRTELEDRGSKAGADELRAAIEAETEALHLVGFDSMLDLHIAMSTGGTGTLVDARRATAATRVAELESELAMLLATTVALHGELQVSFDELQAQADDLVGGLSGRPVAEALRGMIAVPDPVRDALSGLRSRLHTSRAQLEAARREQREIADEAPALDLRSAVANAGALRATSEVEQAEHAREAALAAVDDWDRTLGGLRHQWSEADAAVAATTAAVDALASRRYLEDDRSELSRALIATLVEHARWLASGAGSEDGVSATALVLDDPLDELADTDAIAVLDDMVAVAWPLPVVYVTSRGPLVLRLRQDAGHLVCVDGRRKPRTSSRWLKRTTDAYTAGPH